MAFKWKPLLELLGDPGQSVVPIIGREAVRVLDGGADVPFETLVARRVQASLALGGEPAADLRRIAFDALCRHHKLGAVVDAVKEASDEVAMQVTEPSPLLSKLAQIEAFDLFVTTTIDPLLGQALRARRDVPLQELAYRLRGRGDDLASSRRNPGAPPTVYHLLGRASYKHEFAVTERDVLEMLYSLQGETRPKNLFLRLRESCLLVLGCGFPDWLMRFLLRIVGDAPIEAERKQYLAEDGLQGDQELVVFLSHYGTQVYTDGNVEAFVSELHARWQGRAGSGLPPPPRPATAALGPVFLSYAREDRVAVERLAQDLEKSGVSTWFDKSDLKYGDVWARQIEQAIQRSSLFVPVISARVAERAVRPEGAFVFAEWHWALQRARQFPLSRRYFWPLYLDDTPDAHDFVLPEFRQAHAARCVGESPPAEFMDGVRSEFRRLRGAP